MTFGELRDQAGRLRAGLQRLGVCPEDVRPSVMGVAPPYLMACRKAGLQPGRDCELDSIRVLCTAGSPLPAEGYLYGYEQLGPEMLLINRSGGTDVCTGIVSGSFAQPVYEGEISGPCPGVAAHAFDSLGREVVGELGELVITQPMPSMPVSLWNDPDGSRYRDSYFARYPGVWRQGDWVKFAERGSCIITGRSDATLNRGAAQADRRSAALRALAAARSRRDHDRPGDPPHPDRQEARGAGQADPAGLAA